MKKKLENLIEREIFKRNLSGDEVGGFTISKPDGKELDETLDALECMGAHWEIAGEEIYISFSPANLKEEEK